MDGSTIIARWRQCAPLRNACFLGPRRVQIPNASRSVRPFLHSSRQRAPLYFTMGRPLPSKLPLLTGYLDPNLIYDSLGPSESIIQTAYRSVQSFLQGSLLWQTDRCRALRLVVFVIWRARGQQGHRAGYPRWPLVAADAGGVGRGTAATDWGHS